VLCEFEIWSVFRLVIFENLFYDLQHFDAGDVCFVLITSHADYFCWSYSCEICQESVHSEWLLLWFY